jgi:hypothetical protein
LNRSNDTKIFSNNLEGQFKEQKTDKAVVVDYHKITMMATTCTEISYVSYKLVSGNKNPGA